MSRILAIFALALLIAAPVHAAFAGDPGFRGCVIADTLEGVQYDDVECDKVPDVFDNCPLTHNPAQLDRDQNGIGDACDLVIDEIVLSPERPMQGRSAVAQAYLVNFRQYPMRNLVVKLDIPSLGVAATEEVAILNPGERKSVELIVRIPECAQTKFHDFVVYAEYPFAPGQKEVFAQPLKVPVVPGGSCAQETGDERTIVNILELQDVHPETGALYPFTIHNRWPESKAYILRVEGLEEWGGSEINPGSVIVIPPGESRDGAIQIWANPAAEPGERAFLFTVQAREDIRQVQLLADIPEGPVRVAPAGRLVLGVLGFVALLAVIALAALLFWRRRK